MKQMIGLCKYVGYIEMMKCEECKKKLTVVCYFEGKKVCPSCFDVLKWRSKRLSPEEYAKVVERRILSRTKRSGLLGVKTKRTQ